MNDLLERMRRLSYLNGDHPDEADRLLVEAIRRALERDDCGRGWLDAIARSYERAKGYA